MKEKKKMPIEKAFDPTLTRVSSSEPRDTQLPDDVDIDEGYVASSSDLFVDTLDKLSADGPLPPPLEGEGEPTTPLLAEAAEEVTATLRDKLSSADKHVRAFVERRPIVALCGAAAAGFLIGRIVTRL